MELSIPYDEKDLYDDSDQQLIRLDHSFISSEYAKKIDRCNDPEIDSLEYDQLGCSTIQNENSYPYNAHLGWHFDPTPYYLENPKYTHSDGQPIFPYYAATDGCVTRVEIDNPVGSSYVDSNVGVIIDYGGISVVYLFEPQGTVDESDNYEYIKYVQNTQKSLIKVKPGQAVHKGDLIGYLYTPESRSFNPTMHFHVAGDNIGCPSKYFSSSAHSKIQTLLESVYPKRDLCYE